MRAPTLLILLAQSCTPVQSHPRAHGASRDEDQVVDPSASPDDATTPPSTGGDTGAEESTGSDLDGDGLSRQEEVDVGSDPERADTDADSVPDGAEVRLTRTSPIADGRTCAVPFVALEQPSRAERMLARDLDADGDDDLLVSTSDPLAVIAWERTRTGAWTLHPVLDGCDLQQADVGDLDADSDLDLALWCGDAVVWVPQEATFSFGPRILAVELASTPTALQVHDLDGDRRADLVVSEGGAHTIGWYRSLEGGFGQRRTILEAPAAPFVCGDVDRDGDLDVVAAGDSRGAAVIENLQGGAFGAPYWMGRETDLVELADPDADGDLDLLVSSFLSSRVRWFERRGAEWRDEALLVDIEHLNFHSLVGADLALDGGDDVIMASFYVFPMHVALIVDGVVTADHLSAVDEENYRYGDPYELQDLGALLDWNLDGHLDLLASSTEGFLVVMENRLGADQDDDGVTDLGELCISGTDLDRADTDHDGVNDLDELLGLTDPLDPEDR